MDAKRELVDLAQNPPTITRKRRRGRCNRDRPKVSNKDVLMNIHEGETESDVSRSLKVDLMVENGIWTTPPTKEDDDGQLMGDLRMNVMMVVGADDLMDDTTPEQMDLMVEEQPSDATVLMEDVDDTCADGVMCTQCYDDVDQRLIHGVRYQDFQDSFY